jgi:uncharacterized protein (DUF2062 family)
LKAAARSASVRELLYRRLVQPVVDLLTQGVSPEKIALSLAMGVVLGIFPMLGATTILCAAAAIIFRLNLPAIQLVNYLVYPLQLLLFLPFIRAGEFLFRAQPLKLSLSQILDVAKTDPRRAVSVLWVATSHAIVGWMLLGPLLIFLLYLLLKHLTRRLALMTRRNAAEGAA